MSPSLNVYSVAGTDAAIKRAVDPEKDARTALESRVAAIEAGGGSTPTQPPVPSSVDLTAVGEVDAKQAGAKGDGGTDDSAVIQGLLDAGKPVYLPPGRYVLGTPLTIPTKARLRGAGKESTVLLPATDGLLVDGSKQRNGVYVADLRIEANAGACIKGFNVKRSKFERMELVQRSADHPAIDGRDSTLLLVCTFDMVDTWVYGAPRTVPGIVFTSAATDAMTQTTFSNLSWWNGDWEASQAGVVDNTQPLASFAATGTSNKLRNNKLVNVVFENGRGGGVVLASCTGWDLVGCSSWDTKANTVVAPMIRLTQTPGNSLACQDTQISRFSRVGEGPTTNTVDILVEPGCSRTVVENCFTSASGTPLKVDMGSTSGHLSDLPSNVVLTRAGVATLLRPVDASQFATKKDLENLTAAPVSTPKEFFDRGSRHFSAVSYWWPDWNSATRTRWADVLAFGDDLGVCILDRNDGTTWSEYDSVFHEQGRRAAKAGARAVTFYVKTQFAAASLPEGDPFKALVDNADTYTHDHILGLLDACKTNYPDIFRGVFLDEVITGLGDTAGRITWYKDLTDKIRARYGKDFLIVANTVTGLADEMLDLDIDVFMLVENTSERYITGNGLGRVTSDRIKAEPPTRFWHTVHGVTKENVDQVMARLEAFGPGHVYLTDGVLVPSGAVVGQPVVSQYANPPSAWVREKIQAWVNRATNLDKRVNALESSKASQGILEVTGSVPGDVADGTLIIREA